MAVFMALLIIPILAMVAFAIDIGWITDTKIELQSAADASALAGAQQLMGDSSNENGYVNYYLPGQTNQSAILATAKANARAAAKKVALNNSAGGVKSLALNDADIEFGYTDSNYNYTPMPPYSGFPNTVKVTMRRDNQANGPLGLFFAPVIGTNSVNITTVAAATIYTASVNSFNSASKLPFRILPMTYDVNHWNNFLATGKGPDGSVDTLSANGAPELQVYPSIKFTGNFGELSLDQNNDGASTISNWITNGVPWSDLQNEYNAGLLPLAQHDHTKWDWKGNPGLKTSTIHTLENEIGTMYLLPLYLPVDPNQATYQPAIGQGSHYYYNIVQFVGITITYVDNKGVHVQPTALLDPNAIPTSGSPAPAAPPTQSNPLVTTYIAAKLTQ
jgi:Flp pilus assembly protein TadG